MTIKVRLFAALREMAGSSEVDATGRTAGELVDELSERLRGALREGRRGRLDRRERRAGRPIHAIAEDDEVALLPPVSGG